MPVKYFHVATLRNHFGIIDPDAAADATVQDTCAHLGVEGERKRKTSEIDRGEQRGPLSGWVRAKLG